MRDLTNIAVNHEKFGTFRTCSTGRLYGMLRESEACTVTDASLVWGFKENFRAYIDGSIANVSSTCCCRSGAEGRLSKSSFARDAVGEFLPSTRIKKL